MQAESEKIDISDNFLECFKYGIPKICFTQHQKKFR